MARKIDTRHLEVPLSRIIRNSRLRFTLILMIIMTSLAISLSWANSFKRVAVLPFTVHGADDGSAVRQGILRILSASLMTTEKINIVSDEEIVKALKPMESKDILSTDNIYALGKKVNADYVVYGDIEGVGHNISISGMLFDVAAYRPVVSMQGLYHGIYEAVPELDYFARRIDNYLIVLP